MRLAESIVHLNRLGFKQASFDQVGVYLYTKAFGVFFLRVRLAAAGVTVSPALWFGFTAGPSLCERRSRRKYSSNGDVVADAEMLARVLRSTR